MRAPVRVSFQGTAASPALRREIVEHVDALERFHGRITACHVIVKAPDRHHRTGGLFEISLHIVLPGGTSVDIDRTPRLDERFSDVRFAVSDCFRRARRRLQDRIRLQRGDIKTHRQRPRPARSRQPAT
jgi:hypothetical protein